MRIYHYLLITTLVVVKLIAATTYRVGVGIADVTGPSAEIVFMGYAKVEQKGTGIHTRQWARTTIIDDGTERAVFVNIDSAMMGDSIRQSVIEELKKKYGTMYNLDNVMLSGTHTHSVPGGYLGHLLFDLTSFGFVHQTFDAYRSGIVKSVEQAHNNMEDAKIYLNIGELHNCSYNRSPFAYENNPEEEKARYKYNTDKIMFQLKFTSTSGREMGLINWFAVHPVSMNNTNTLVSSDNQGLAGILFEQIMNPNRQIGKGPFVASFGSSNLGDVSPNIMGPRCIRSGLSCNNLKSTCPSIHDPCIAFGPGSNMYESTYIIGHRIYRKAMELWKQPGIELSGPVKVIQQYVDMPKQQATFYNHTTGEIEQVRGCLPGMGASFAAGTTDGPGAFVFSQGTKTLNPLWNFLRDFLADPTPDYINCHAPKPILLPTGLMSFPHEWQPAIVSTSISMIGNVAIICVPGEFTTMSGRRLRETVEQVMRDHGIQDPHATIAGLCNTYSDYIATPEEYQIQRYEGASTLFGPHTLTIYLKQYKKLAEALLNNDKPKSEDRESSDTSCRTCNPPYCLNNRYKSFAYYSISHLLENEDTGRGPKPPILFDNLISLAPPVVFDTPSIGQEYGNVVVQPPRHGKPGDTVRCRLVAGHPRNNLKLDETFLTVELRDRNGKWIVVATDANWETKFKWVRKSPVLGTSEVIISWTIPEDVVPGEYRLRHFGNYKYIFGGIYPYEGTCRSIKVTNTFYNEL